MNEFELLVGSGPFWRRAAEDCRGARRRLLVQAMTFEGDAAGLSVAAAIAASGAHDRRVLVDDYSRLVINDGFVRSPAALFDRPLREEARATHDMFEALIRAGVGVRVTNPLRGRLWRYPARNHKKLIVADDVAYVGGVNFSDHNFAWRDFMVRIEGEAAARFLAEDFAATFAGRPRAASADLGDLTLHLLDGRTNEAGFAPIMDLIAGAQREITVISPYLSFPFTDALARAAGRGVAIELITPWANNKPTVRNALLAAAKRGGFHVRLLPRMIHLKGMLIDRRVLVVGSSNFDFVSMAAEEELVAVISAPEIIQDFQRRVIDMAREEALPGGIGRIAPLAGWASHGALKIAEGAALAARNAPRTAVDWPG